MARDTTCHVPCTKSVLTPETDSLNAFAQLQLRICASQVSQVSFSLLLWDCAPPEEAQHKQRKGQNSLEGDVHAQCQEHQLPHDRWKVTPQTCDKQHHYYALLPLFLRTITTITTP
eukprot:jgi/Botrbrau1/18101/Bobra.0687s0003.1